MGLDMTIKQPRTPLDAHSADEPTDAPIRQGPDVEPEYSYSITESPEADILHLNHKKSLYTFEFPLHDIRDGKLRVSKIRELAAGMTYVPKSLRHLVELSCKETKLLIDGTPIRNYGISSGDTIKVESPQFREPDPMDSLSSNDLWLDDGHRTEGNMELEGKAERDKRRAEFSRELRQRAMMDSSSDQRPVPKTTSNLEIMETRLCFWISPTIYRGRPQGCKNLYTWC